METKKICLKIASALIITAITVLCSSCSKTGENRQKSGKNNTLTALSDKTYMSLDNTCIGFGIGKTAENERPVDCERLNERYKDCNALFIGEDNNKVYLTFDEGYENGYTAKILDTLKEKKVKAAFFVTYDYVRDNKKLVKRMIDEGHIVGNHTYTHPSMPSKSVSGMKNEVINLHNYVKENFGYEMTLFRFPRGEYSNRALAVVRDCGYKSVFWSFAYVDWKTESQPDKNAAKQKILSKTHNGAVVLLHAVSSTNAEILGDVIDQVREKGYEWSSL